MFLLRRFAIVVLQLKPSHTKLLVVLSVDNLIMRSPSTQGTSNPRSCLSLSRLFYFILFFVKQRSLQSSPDRPHPQCRLLLFASLGHVCRFLFGIGAMPNVTGTYVR